MTTPASAPLLSPVADKRGYVTDSVWMEWFKRLDLIALSPSISGALLAVNNLSDVSNVATAAHNLGLGTADTPIHTGLRLTGLTPLEFVGTDATDHLVSIPTASLQAAIGLGATSTPTFAGLTLDNLNGILAANFGSIASIGVGPSLSFVPGLLNTIQDIRQTATPQFVNSKLTGLTASLPVFTSSTKTLATKSIPDTRTFLGIEQATHVAGENLLGHRVVRIDASNQAWYANRTASADTDAIYGLTLGSALTGGSVLVQYFGPIYEVSWTWTTASALFLDVNGVMTQTPPTAGFLLQVGFAVTPTKIMFSPKMPIVLE